MELNRHRFEPLAEEQDRQLQPDGSIVEARAKLFSPPLRSSRRWWVALSAAAAVIAIAITFATPSPSPITLSADTPASDGGWYTAEEAPVPLAFSDGTEVVLAAGTRARVGTLRPSGADVVVERGRLEVYVVRGPGTSWSFHVGPYDVAVIGTRFSVAWQPRSERFELSMHEGTVDVVGPGVAARRLSAGKALVVDARLGEAPVVRVTTVAAMAPPSAPLSPPPGENGTPTAAPPVETEPATTATASVTGPPSPAAGPSWRELARRGDYAAAYAAVAPRIDAIMASGSADDLAALADVANLQGQTGQARAAYLALRNRFAGKGRAARAAFALGRMAFGSDPSGAAQWFETYLAEAPNGGLAREALGRVLEIRRSGPSGPAVARRYLTQFPDGPHAELARRTLATQPRERIP